MRPMDGPRCGPLTIIEVTRERRGARSAALICAACTVNKHARMLVWHNPEGST
jgi:hypothetical protein